MNENLDYLFNEEQETKTDKTQPERLSGEDYAAKKEAERQTVYDLADNTAKAVATNGTAFQSYLNTMSRFELYSPTNTLLIYAQRPDATRLRDYDKWKEAGTPVKEKGAIMIIEREDYKRDDSSTGYNYNVKKLFDISQTTAKPSEPPKALSIKLLCQALIKSSTSKVVLVNELSGDAKGTTGAQYIPEIDQIEIVKGLDGQSIFRCLSQEIAFANLDHIPAEKLPCNDKDFTAYAASYALCQKYGIDTKDYNFSKVPEYFSNVEDKDLRKEIGAVRDTVADISSEMSKSIEQLQKAAKNQDAR